MLSQVNEYVAVLDSCVLVPMPICDTLLRLAEAGFFIPKWSPQILDETAGVLRRLGRTKEQIGHRLQQMALAFEDAVVTGYEPLVAGMPINDKDGHVLAAAVRAQANVIVTENLKDFPTEALAQFGIEAQDADEFLLQQYNLAPDGFLEIVRRQAEENHMELARLIDLLAVMAPRLRELFSA